MALKEANEKKKPGPKPDSDLQSEGGTATATATASATAFSINQTTTDIVNVYGKGACYALKSLFTAIFVAKNESSTKGLGDVINWKEFDEGILEQLYNCGHERGIKHR